MKQIYRKYSKFVGKLIVYKFIDRFRINSLVNPSINLATDDIRL